MIASNEEIDLAKHLGYEAILTANNGHEFTQGERHVWSIYSNGPQWQTADLKDVGVNRMYTNHMSFDDLSDALRRKL